MADDKSAEAQQKQVAFQRIYTKDVSAESPNSPDEFAKDWRPHVDVQLNTQARHIEDARYEVVLEITVTAKQDEKTVYLIEIQQAGVFVMSGLNDQELRLALNTYCPHTLLPFARELIADLIQRAGYPQFLLQPVNFEALYQQHMQQAKAAQSEAETAVKH